MPENEILVALAKLESGQLEIIRRIDKLEESHKLNRADDADTRDRLTRLEERNALLMKLLWGGIGAGGGSLGWHVLNATNLIQ